MSITLSELHHLNKYLNKKFAGKTYARRWGQESFVYHCSRVGQNVQEMTDDPDIIKAAYLHDVLEDTDTTFRDLMQDFNIVVASHVDILSRKPAEPYLTEYIERVAKYPETRIIKIADLMDNILHCVEKGGEYLSKLERYNKALNKLLTTVSQ